MKILVKCHDRAIIADSVNIEFGLDGQNNIIRFWGYDNDYFDVVPSSSYNMVDIADSVYHSSYPILYADNIQWSGDDDD